jgi:cell division protease FtsH
MVSDLLKNNVKVVAKPEEEQSFLMNLFVSWFPMLLLIGVWIFFMRQMQGGGRGGAFSFGKSKARMLDESTNTVTFADVAGCDEAKEEVRTGRVPARSVQVPEAGRQDSARRADGRLPRHRQDAAGQGHRRRGQGAVLLDFRFRLRRDVRRRRRLRVRDMFEQAKKQAPCIIFIDEIDAVGRQRGAGLGGGNDEREQTLNQLLVEMDGFEGNEGVIVIAATNRPDVLDPALLRPGRFDRQVVVPLPDIRGREQILKVHMRKVPLARRRQADDHRARHAGLLRRRSRQPGQRGGAVRRARNKRMVDMDDFERAKDKIMMGAERRSMVMSEEEKRNTAYHESGPRDRRPPAARRHDPVHKVTIIPRGRALGVTMFSCRSRTATARTRPHAETMMPCCSAAASPRSCLHAPDDHRRLQRLRARDRPRARMVTQWGMSDRSARWSTARNEGEVFLGRSVTQTHKNMSEETMQQVDAEIRRIIDEQYAAGAQAARGQPRQGRGDDQGAARVGDDRRRPDRRHHGGPAAAAAEAVAVRRAARPMAVRRAPAPQPAAA